MKKYLVYYTVPAVRRCEVEAESQEEAEQNFLQDKGILSYDDDFLSTNFIDAEDGFKTEVLFADEW